MSLFFHPPKKQLRYLVEADDGATRLTYTGSILIAVSQNLLSEEFRKTFKKDNPTVKVVSVVGKTGGEKWKSLCAAGVSYLTEQNGDEAKWRGVKSRASMLR
ncbi:hypothetical protein L6452_16012 [Arctium lappa]|uniref:Uncharacterized protein n=1 Tax=Arctium lappa TaxID=4217 RepID=A0ACB9CQC7_ARCLA|nr:hypothetical protein L6452_16012 [Arctium lappa]